MPPSFRKKTRRASPEAVVAITGVSGQLGGTLARLLEEEDRVRRVVGLDVRPMEQTLAKTGFVRRDVAEPGLDELFRAEGVTHVAHFAFILDALHDRQRAQSLNVGGSRNVLQAAAAVGAAKVVVTSSSVVFGAHSDNPPAIPEGHPQRPHPDIQYTLDKVEVERLCEDFARQNPGPRVVVLRPVTIVGPHMANFISRYLARSLMLLPRGLDPPFQFVHELDCARAACTMLFNDLSGAYNLGADGTVTLAEVGRRSGRHLVRVPRAIMKAMAELGWRLRLRGLSESNGAVVDFLCYVPVLDNAKIKREAGFSFRYTSSEAINDYVASRNSAAGTGRAGAT